MHSQDTNKIERLAPLASSMFEQKGGVHTNASFRKCDLCPYRAKTNHNRELGEHKLVEHEGIKFKCEQCKWEGNRSAHLAKHVKIEHEGLRYYCASCDFQAKDPSHLREHENGIHKNVRLQCKLCPKEVKYRSSLIRHMKESHKQIEYNCSKCNFSARYVERLKKHTDRFHLNVYLPKQQNEMKCKFCDEWFHKEKSNQHLKLHHKDIVIQSPNVLQLTCREENKMKYETKTIQRHGAINLIAV